MTQAYEFTTFKEVVANFLVASYRFPAYPCFSTSSKLLDFLEVIIKNTLTKLLTSVGRKGEYSESLALLRYNNFKTR